MRGAPLLVRRLLADRVVARGAAAAALEAAPLAELPVVVRPVPRLIAAPRRHTPPPEGYACAGRVVGLAAVGAAPAPRLEVLLALDGLDDAHEGREDLVLGVALGVVLLDALVAVLLRRNAV